MKEIDESRRIRRVEFFEKDLKQVVLFLTLFGGTLAKSRFTARLACARKPITQAKMEAQLKTNLDALDAVFAIPSIALFPC